MTKTRKVEGRELEGAIADSIDGAGPRGATLAGVRLMVTACFDEPVAITAADVKGAVARLCRAGELEARERLRGGRLTYGNRLDVTYWDN